MKQPRETIIAAFSPKVKTYILLLVGLILLIGLFTIPLLLVWFLGLGQYISRRYYDNLRCELTAKDLRFSKGVLFKVEKTIPLENIQDLTFIQGPILKMLELYILKIETAGGSGNAGGADMKLVGVVDANGLKEKALEYRRAIMEERSVGVDDQLTVLKEIRDELRAMREKG